MTKIFVCLVLATLLAGCRRGEPPAAEVDAAVAALPPPGRGVGARGAPDAGATDGGVDAPEATPPSPAADAGASGGPDPAALPQTKDKPTGSGPAFDARVAALWEGIVLDDPDRALPCFFPLGAYEQVKAVGNPAADWRRRLVAAYKRDIHALHGRLGDRAKSAKLVRVDVPDDRAKWIDPGDEYNKLGYWRVYGTKIVYEVAGRERTFEISSLISWRGEWYVVHLTGFK